MLWIIWSMFQSHSWDSSLWSRRTKNASMASPYRFQSHSWDSSLWSLAQVASIGSHPTEFQSHSWDSSLWSAFPIEMHHRTKSSFNLILEILLFDRGTRKLPRPNRHRFQSHSWDSSLWSSESHDRCDACLFCFNLILEILLFDRLKSVTMCEKIIDVSISFLRFFSLIVEYIIRSLLGTNVSISFLRFFSLIGRLGKSRISRTSLFQSHSWDSSLWSRTKRRTPSSTCWFQSHSWDSSLWSWNTGTLMSVPIYVSISFLRFFSLIESTAKSRRDSKHCFNLTLEILLFDRNYTMLRLTSRAYVSISRLRFFSLIVIGESGSAGWYLSFQSHAWDSSLWSFCV